MTETILCSKAILEYHFRDGASARLSADGTHSKDSQISLASIVATIRWSTRFACGLRDFPASRAPTTPWLSLRMRMWQSRNPSSTSARSRPLPGKGRKMICVGDEGEEQQPAPVPQPEPAVVRPPHAMQPTPSITSATTEVKTEPVESQRASPFSTR